MNRRSMFGAIAAGVAALCGLKPDSVPFYKVMRITPAPTMLEAWMEREVHYIDKYVAIDRFKPIYRFTFADGSQRTYTKGHEAEIDRLYFAMQQSAAINQSRKATRG
jgi:hypothetical protein